VRYLADCGVLEIQTNCDGGFLIPRTWIGALQGVPANELAKLAVSSDGSAIELKVSDVHIGVDGLLTDVLPALLPESAPAAIFARREGRPLPQPSALALGPRPRNRSRQIGMGGHVRPEYASNAFTERGAVVPLIAILIQRRNGSTLLSLTTYDVKIMSWRAFLRIRP
jgi:hypothetical protein